MKIIKGHYVVNGGSLEQGTLNVLELEGVLVCESAGVLTAAEVAVTKDIKDVEITSEQGAWVFVPASGECARIGLAVSPLAARQ